MLLGDNRIRSYRWCSQFHECGSSGADLNVEHIT